VVLEQPRSDQPFGGGVLFSEAAHARTGRPTTWLSLLALLRREGGLIAPQGEPCICAGAGSVARHPIGHRQCENARAPTKDYSSNTRWSCQPFGRCAAIWSAASPTCSRPTTYSRPGWLCSPRNPVDRSIASRAAVRLGGIADHAHLHVHARAQDERTLSSGASPQIDPVDRCAFPLTCRLTQTAVDHRSAGRRDDAQQTAAARWLAPIFAKQQPAT